MTAAPSIAGANALLLLTASTYAFGGDGRGHLMATPKTTRRQFCKNLLAAGIASASLHTFAKSYCGMDFGSGGSTTVWHKIIPSEVYWRGGRYSGYRQMRDYWRWALGQVSAAELVGGRASTKSLYSKPPERKSKLEDKKAKLDKLRWLWFEEASEFEGLKG